MFKCDADAQEALKRDKASMGPRWIEVTPSTRVRGLDTHSLTHPLMTVRMEFSLPPLCRPSLC